MSSCSDECDGQPITGLCLQDVPLPEGDCVVSLLDTGQAVVRPAVFVEHECGASCHDEVDVSSFRGYNLFAFPLFAGWSREVFDTSLASNGKTVIYVAPCGRSLRHMEEIERFILSTGCPLGIELFTLDPDIELFRPITAVLHQCISYEEDISRGQERQPISVINFLDHDWIDPNFSYCRDRFPGPGVPMLHDPGFSSCCDCIDNCANPLTCSCQRLTNDSFGIIPGLAEVSRVRGYKNKRLDANIPFGIYECNARCSCNAHCPTRVVQKGIQVLLQIFKTSKKGWGVRTLHDIPKGTFITVYSAVILSEESADVCGHTAGDVYFANLDFIDCAEATKEAYESECAFSLDGDDDSGEEIVEDDDNEQENDVPLRDAGDDDEDYVAPLIVPLPPRRVRCDVVPLGTETNGRVPADSYSRPQVAVKSVRGDLVKSAHAATGQEASDSQNGSQDGEATKKPFRSFFEGSNVYILDAMYKGNVGRFFNHSCSPNSFAQNVFFESHDLRFPTVAFFASRNIFALEEITWDYQYEVDSIPGRQLYCKCQSANCRGRLI